jgi:hypothetical protein
MSESTILAGLVLLSTAIIGALVYIALRRPEHVIVYNEPARPSFETHWWGYGWRPFWRKYNGLPGFASKPVKPKLLPNPSYTPLKPIIIPKP